MTILASAISCISHILPELDVLFKYVFLGLLLGLNVSGRWPFVFGFCVEEHQMSFTGKQKLQPLKHVVHLIRPGEIQVVQLLLVIYLFCS